MFKSVLITACGGDIGQGLGRILRDVSEINRIIGCDIHMDHPAALFFDDCELILPANNPDYIRSLSEVISKHQINLIIPTHEGEIKELLKLGITQSFENIPVLLPNEKVIEIGLDKLEVVNFLKENRFAYPWTNIVKDSKPHKLPCVFKMRYGHGSKGFTIINNKEQISYIQHSYPNDLWQELLLPESEEYTCGLYRSQDDEIRTIIFKRKLRGGFTASGQVVDNKEIQKQLIELANKIELRGSINVQLKMTNRGPIIFDINPRFSSTVVFRHLLGFKDFIWSITEKKGSKLCPYIQVKPGIKFYRTIHEYIIDT